ncbi:hypothetical protein [Streptomyces sp. NPDC058424]|uniref:hypothetical protein n=1 Tax=Streptomyces sp. NPDC058424 TaxID=3346491 RepID=UPI00364E0A1B
MVGPAQARPGPRTGIDVKVGWGAGSWKKSFGLFGPRGHHPAGEEVWARWIIVRRRPEDPAKRDYYLGWGPPGTALEDLVLVPGARWRVEEAIKLAKSACGLADYEVRSFHGWYRHITLAQLAAAFLAGCDAQAAREQGPLASTRFGHELPTPAGSQRGGPP